MNYKNAKEAREFRQNLREQQKEILAAVHKDGWTDEQRTTYDKMDSDYDQVDADIKRLERLEKQAAENAKLNDKEQEVKETEGERIRRYLLTGEVPADRREKRANTQTITTTGGGYTIDSILGPDIDKALKAYGGIYENARVIRTDGGNPLEWPTTDDTTVTPSGSVNGHILAINTAATTNADAVVFGQTTLDAYKATSGMLQIPRELLEDSGFDIEAFILNDLMAERVMRVIDYYLVLGSGSSQPNGIASAATYGETLTKRTLVVGDNYTRLDLLNLVHSLDPAYRSNPKSFMIMHDTTLKGVRQITDDYGQPLYNPDPRQGAPDMIEGMKVLVNQRMSTAAGGKTIIVADLDKFAVRMVNGMRLVSTTERFIDADQIGVGAFWRFDSDALQTGALKYGYEIST